MAGIIKTIYNVVSRCGFITKSYVVEGRGEVKGMYFHKCFDCMKEFQADKWDTVCPYCSSEKDNVEVKKTYES